MARITESPRGRNRRQPGYTVLIVCEGAKTEKKYLLNYRHRGTGVKIEIPNTGYTDPLNLVEFAALKADELGINKHTGSVWVVFDVDTNSDSIIERARNKARRTARERKYSMEVILSNPSFELWYLLHFRLSTAVLTNATLLQNLNGHLPRYDKAEDYFAELRKQQETAIDNANSLLSYHTGQGRDLYAQESNPATHVVRLVEYLNGIIGTSQP